jgi:hypothetical protein
MRMAIAFVLLAYSASAQQPAIDSPKITVGPRTDAAKPTEITAAVGELVRLTSSEPKARWELAPGTEGADLDAGVDGRATFAASRPGKFTAINYVCEKPAAWVSIVVGGVPIPPTPVVPPPPANQLVVKLRTAVERDGGLSEPNKQALASLKALCGQSRDYAGKSEIATTGQFVGVVATASRTISRDSLPETRKWLVAELRTLVGDSDVSLTPDKRKEISEAMGRLESAVQEVLK